MEATKCKKGSTTAIAISIAAGLLATTTTLIGFIYTSNASETKTDIKEIEVINSDQDKSIAQLQKDIQYIKESQDKANAKLDKILNKF